MIKNKSSGRIHVTSESDVRSVQRNPRTHTHLAQNERENICLNIGACSKTQKKELSYNLLCSLEENPKPAFPASNVDPPIYYY